MIQAPSSLEVSNSRYGGSDARHRQIARLLSGDDLRRLGAHLDNGNPEILLNSTSRYYISFSPQARSLYHRPALRAAELARLLASVLFSRRTWEIEKSSDRANFRQIQFSE